MALKSISMEFIGMESLKRALRETPDAVRDQLSQAVASSAFSMAQRMKSLVRVDTGTLQRSISSSSSNLVGKVTIGPEGFYWRFLEYGRVGHAAYPFVRAAGEEESVVFERRILSIGRAMEQSWARAA